MPQHRRDSFCGPAGSGLIAVGISSCIPDIIFGVDLSGCCRSHDLDWDDKGACKEADLRFREDIRKAFKEAGKPEYLGKAVANWYYAGVRLGGIVYKLEERFKKA
ncbi:hypothetical protein KAR91_82380 [Candidatus Pacearchaeota archaeon]|nr:hypothetical protein [Candidatus Pacearchaeota archaeon]